MLLLDVLIRYPAVALMLMFTVLALRDGHQAVPARYAAYLSISVAALLLGTSHPDLLLPRAAHITVRFLDAPSVALVWWFGRSLFEDDFTLGWLEWTGMIVIIVTNTGFRLLELGFIVSLPFFFNYLSTITSLLMMAHLYYVIIAGRQDDVIELRRRVRFYFVIGLIAATVLIIISDRVFYNQIPIELSIFRAALVLPLALWGLLWLVRFHPEMVSFQLVNTVVTVEPEIDPRDQSLHRALVDEMQVKQAYIEPGLTIRALAERLKAPEHRLRALINKGMGYRNFSGFLNHYRIEAVKQAMEKPENSRIPVLTLAMNVGFNSLAPFNRAFLAATEQTPTTYRSGLLKDSD